jgi:hypothetical protein
MGHIYKIAEKSPQHFEDDITMSAVIPLWDPEETYRLLMSTSAFLHTRFANRRPTPLIEVRANMIFCLPSTFVLSTRRICWKSSFAMSDCNHPRNKKKNHQYSSFPSEPLVHVDDAIIPFPKAIGNRHPREGKRERERERNSRH